MWKRLKSYRDGIGALLAANDPGTNWDELAQEHLAQILFFQHERLVHLLVTLAFALMELAASLVTVLAPNVFSAAIMGLVLVLLVPYIVHYYHLENGTQSLYAQYDELRRRARSA